MSIGQMMVWAWEIGNIDTKARMTVRAAWDAGYHIILCGICGRPAKVLDALFPYYQEHNHCEIHMRKRALGGEMSKGRWFMVLGVLGYVLISCGLWTLVR